MESEKKIKAPPLMKQSRAKIWIRTVVLTVFSVIFGLALYRDLTVGILHPLWALVPFTVCLGIGFYMSRLVPMQACADFNVVTLSFDKTYFALIWVLVILKVIASGFLGLNILADVVMSGILGLMMGRLSGICLRVRDLKDSIN